MTITTIPVSPDSGPLWKIPLARYTVNTCSLELLDTARRKTHYKNCLASHSVRPHSRAIGLLSTLMQCPHQDTVGSPDPPAPSQDTHSAPLQAEAGSTGSGPRQGRLSFLTLEELLILAPFHQSMRVTFSPSHLYLVKRALILCAVLGMLITQKNFQFFQNRARKAWTREGRAFRCSSLGNPEGLRGTRAILVWLKAASRTLTEESRGQELKVTSVCAWW